MIVVEKGEVQVHDLVIYSPHGSLLFEDLDCTICHSTVG